MNFAKLEINYYYNNEENNIIKEFFEPVLSNSIEYKRASGCFSSSYFWSMIEAIYSLADNNSIVKLIVSPNLSDEDVQAIINGEKVKNEIIDSFLMFKIIDENEYKDQYNLLAWLLYEGKLELKIVTKRDINSYGIFNDKWAVFTDKFKNKIGFNGSLNESLIAYEKNFESINVYCSWRDNEKLRIDKIEEAFDKIWFNKSAIWESYSIPENIKSRIIEGKSKKKPEIYFNNYNKGINIPRDIKLREYQKIAIKKWFDNKCTGILEMATGSGKTLTSIFAMKKLIDLLNSKGFPCGVVIVVPYINLLEQWCEELEEFGVRPIRCCNEKSSWYYKAIYEVSNFNLNNFSSLFMIVTNATFISDSFQVVLGKIQRDYIFCVDEVHHLSAPKISKLLPENTKFRLGLTATLNNDYNEKKENKVLRYFEKIVYTFSLKEAMENNCLTRYYYYPIFVELNEDEREEYLNLSRKIARLYNISESDEAYKMLIHKRRRIILNAENKIIKFATMKKEISKYNSTLVYCGDKIDDEGKFVDRVNRIIYDMGINTHTYTSDLKKNQREDVLDRFKKNEIKVLTAIRCLDEGVNIPALDCAFILSSSIDSKQFIQRRGRILRKSPGKEFAYIYDFVVVPTLDKNIIQGLEVEEKHIEQKIVLNELNRMFEFASLCENKIKALEKIRELICLYEEE